MDHIEERKVPPPPNPFTKRWNDTIAFDDCYIHKLSEFMDDFEDSLPLNESVLLVLWNGNKQTRILGSAESFVALARTIRQSLLPPEEERRRRDAG